VGRILGCGISGDWTTRGVSYVAEARKGFLLWSSAPAGAGPTPLVRVKPDAFSVIASRDERDERVLTVMVSGRRSTVVIPHHVLAVLEREWADANTPAKRPV